MSINVLRTMTEMAACLLAQIEADGLPEPCWTGIMPGSQAVASFMPSCFDGESPDGMAWVRMSTAYPAMEPGLQIDTPLNSMIAPMGYELEVGIARSLPVPQEGIDPAEAAKVTDLQIRDMHCIRKAILCCEVFERGDLLLGPYTPFGPEGAIVGGSFQLGVQSP